MRCFLLSALVLTATTGVPANAQSLQGRARSTRDGIYTEGQARRGAMVMREVCAACHAEAEFTGTFLQSWNGATVAALYQTIRTQMPDDRPGALEPRQYVDVLAYILSLNGVPPGTTELATEDEALGAIHIEWRP